MNETGRGVLIFVSALITIWLWAPLSNQPSRTVSGTIINETYFGPLHYLVLHTELKEPDYKMERRLDPTRLAITTLLSAGLWVAVIWKVKGKPLTLPDSTANGTDAK